MIAPAGSENGAEWQPDAASWSGSRRLWSLYDMLEKHGFRFFILSLSLERLNKQLGNSIPNAFRSIEAGDMGDLGKLPAPSDTEADSSSSDLTDTSVSTHHLTDKDRKDIYLYLRYVKILLNDINMTSINAEVDRAIYYASMPDALREKSKWQVENITNRILEELKEQLFLHMIPNKSAPAYHRASASLRRR